MRPRRFSSRWFRVYDESVDDPKLQMLSDKQHRFLFNCWCLASKNSGFLPPLEEIAWRLRRPAEQVRKMIQELQDRNLIDAEGERFTPHNWAFRQFESDVSTERVRRFRERHETVSETDLKLDETVSGTVSETAPDTDTDTEQNRTEQTQNRNGGGSVRAADLNGPTSMRFEEWFDGIWQPVRGNPYRTEACHAYTSVVSVPLETDAFECARSYVHGPGSNPHKGYRPDNFLFVMAADRFQTRWPPAGKPQPKSKIDWDAI